MGIRINIGSLRIGSSRAGSWSPEKTTSGLIYKTDFDDFSSWVNDGTFSKVADDALISFDKLPIEFVQIVDATIFKNGVRNPVILQEDNKLYNFYNGDDLLSQANAHVFSLKYAESSNGGKTWTRKGDLMPVVDKNNNPINAHANGWVIKEGSYYYCFRVSMNTPIHDVDGEPSATIPYLGDIWRATALNGTWEWISDIPDNASSWADHSTIPGSVIKVAGVYYLAITGYNAPGTSYTPVDGLMTANSLSGSFTLATNPILGKTETDLRPENPRIFYHSILQKYICLHNAYHLGLVDGVLIMKTLIQISASISDWSSASLRTMQSRTQMDTTNIVGMLTPVITPDYGIVIGQNNFIPAMYDNSGLFYTPTYNYGRTISTVMMEPSKNTLRFDGSASGKIYKAQANTDFIIEFGVQFPAYTAGEIISLVYRADGTGANEYILQIQNGGAKLRLIKRVSSSNTTIETGTASQVVTLGMINRIKVVVSGTSHKAYINGQLQINSTDAALSSGTHIGFFGNNVVNGDVRLVSIRSSDLITINDLPEGTEVELRADGGIVAATALANASGVVTVTLNHWPMESLYVNSVNYLISGGIWGGDVFSFAGKTLPVVTFNPVISATIENAAPTQVVLTFQYALNESAIPDLTVFTLTGKTITSISISGARVTITVSVAYTYSDIVTINYTRGFGNVLRSLLTTNIKSFTGQSVTNNISITDVNGNIYTEVVIGTQTWLKENLKVTKYRDATVIPTALSDVNWALEDGTSGHDGSYSQVNNDAGNKAVYGLLYNWFALVNAKVLAPVGYHIPTRAEITTLVTYLGGSGIAGAKLKEAGLVHWQTPNTDADNSSGFTKLPGGWRSDAGVFGYINQYGYLWSVTEYLGTDAYFDYAEYNTDNFTEIHTMKQAGFTVRCIKD